MQDSRQLFIRADQLVTNPDNIIGGIHLRQVIGSTLPVTGNPLIRFQDDSFTHTRQKDFHLTREQGCFDRFLILVILDIEMSAQHVYDHPVRFYKERCLFIPYDFEIAFSFQLHRARIISELLRIDQHTVSI